MLSQALSNEHLSIFDRIISCKFQPLRLNRSTNIRIYLGEDLLLLRCLVIIHAQYPSVNKNKINLTPARSLSASGGGATASLALMIGMMFMRSSSLRVPLRLNRV